MHRLYSPPKNSFLESASAMPLNKSFDSSENFWKSLYRCNLLDFGIRPRDGNFDTTRTTYGDHTDSRTIVYFDGSITNWCQCGSTLPAAEIMASITPGKRISRSSNRTEFINTLPSLLLATTPDSLRTLKWCDKVDLGIGISNAPHATCPALAILRTISIRTGSPSAWRTLGKEISFRKGICISIFLAICSHSHFFTHHIEIKLTLQCCSIIFEQWSSSFIEILISRRLLFGNR